MPIDRQAWLAKDTVGISIIPTYLMAVTLDACCALTTLPNGSQEIRTRRATPSFPICDLLLSTYIVSTLPIR